MAGYTVSGNVGVSLAGVNVVLSQSGSQVASTTSASDGSYLFSTVQNGSYTITVSQTGYSFSPASQSITVSGGPVSSGTSFTATQLTVATPTFSVSGGSYLGLRTFTVSSSTSGATFYYTLDGTTPTTGSSVAAGGSISIGLGTTVVKVLATATYFINSAVASAAYTVFPVSISGNAGIAGATLTLSGAASATAISDDDGSYWFEGLQNGSYVVTPSLSGSTFSPASLSPSVNGANVEGVNFSAAPTSAHWSQPDCRVSPNATLDVQGTQQYVVVAPSNPNLPPVDSRVNKPVDCRKPANIPENSRTTP
jgi:hypothetical protein